MTRGAFCFGLISAAALIVGTSAAVAAPVSQSVGSASQKAASALTERGDAGHDSAQRDQHQARTNGARPGDRASNWNVPENFGNLMPDPNDDEPNPVYSI